MRANRAEENGRANEKIAPKNILEKAEKQKKRMETAVCVCAHTKCP